MNAVYQKLNAARDGFHNRKLKKTGKNTFAGYSYFELGDFLIPALECFAAQGLCAIVSFTDDTASMRIVAIEDGSEIVITSPMGSAALKGCHEVQNIGAVETYQRRYLWVAAMEIVEHDALDATMGKAEPELKRAKVAFPVGPAKGIHELKQLSRPLYRDLQACGDEDELQIVIANNKELLDQIEAGWPDGWDGIDGDGNKYPGFKELSEAAFSKKEDA